MRFAQRVFLIAGLLGLLAILPMYFMERQINLEDAPAITHPEFYYGFVGVVLAFQVAFLMIASDPLRYRPMMIPAMIEKFSFVLALVGIYAAGRGEEVMSTMPFAGAIDGVLGVLFVIAWYKTRERD